MNAVKSVIFDLDGTLVDSADDIIVALNHGLQQASRERMAYDAARRIISLGLERMVELALAETGGLPDNEELAHIKKLSRDYYNGHLLVHTRAYDGMARLLSAFRDRGLRLGICTNKHFAPARHVLAGLDLEVFFDVIVARDTQPQCKPHPEPLLAALRALDTERSAAVMVGDSGIDVACARAACVPVIVLRHGYSEVPADELKADLVLDGAADLSSAIAVRRAAPGI